MNNNTCNYKKIIFYNLNGTIKKEEILIKDNLKHISGMMTKCYMTDGKEEVGFANLDVVHDKEKYDENMHDYIYLSTWDNLDEETGKLIGNIEEKYNQTFKKVDIDRIEKVETILYSNSRYGGKLTNKFEFYSNNMNEKLDIPDFLKEKNKDKDNNNEIESDESYYFLTVKYEDFTGDKEYNYISEDTTIGVGDRILVDRAGNLAVAIVLGTGYFNKFDSPFPVSKTKRIIKKIDEDFILEDIGFNNETMPKDILKMKLADTAFEFGILGYVSGADNDDDWATIIISVHNTYFNYSTKAELMSSSEIETVLKELERLLADEINEKKEIEFFEPDLEINLYPKINLWDTGKYSYIKEGYEIQDIYMELNINLTDKEGRYTGEKYVMIFDREEIEKIAEYIKKVINSA